MSAATEIREVHADERWHGQLLNAGWWVLFSSDQGPIAYSGPYPSRGAAAQYLRSVGDAA